MDFWRIEAAFSGGHLAHGVKTQRSRLARVPAAPIRDAVTAALAEAGLLPGEVFTSRDGSNWWRALTRAAEGERSVSFLTATGILRVAARSGATVDQTELHAALGRVVRARVAAPVSAGRGSGSFTQLDLDRVEVDALTDVGRGARVGGGG